MIHKVALAAGLESEHRENLKESTRQRVESRAGYKSESREHKTESREQRADLDVQAPRAVHVEVNLELPRP
jgi:hypothetical protein